MAVPKKHIRGKRARQRQREKRGVDLRGRYRPGDLPPRPDFAIVEFPDPYSGAGWVNPEGTLDPEARLKQAARADGSVAEGAPEWVAPPRPRVRAIARLKEDPLGRMNARGRLSQPQFLAGREYQLLHDSTQIGSVRSVDFMKTRVSGGARFEPLTDARQRASKKLHRADEALMHRHGAEGLSVLRDVLCERRSLEQAGRLRGAKSAREILWFGSLFRRCLSALAVQFGFASSTRRPPRLHRFNGDGGIPDTADVSMHAGAGELANPALRRGRRPNGHGRG